MNKMEGTSLDLEKLNIEKIKELFPNVVTEGKVDFDKLRIILGDQIDDRVEKYQFTWNGKSDTIKLAQSPSTGTLIPSKEDSKNWDTTGNLFIEGDNLEVLKQLQKTYYGKVKMIYIDPPYNTGGDFVYKDDFRNNIKNYKEQTQQTSRANPETNGRYHTDWLNMMYSRLMLAKNLLTQDGLIFLSIDDTEYANLNKILHEIFGESNYIATAVRKRRDSQANLSKNISPIHEYVLIYSKTDQALLNKTKADVNINSYKNPDDDPRGPYVTMPCTNKGGAIYEVETPFGGMIKEEWRFKRETYDKLLNENKIVFPREGKGKPRYKLFLSEKLENGVLPNTWWDKLDSNQEATKEIKSLFDYLVFDTPKPTGFIKYCLELATKKDSIILDFFSGSSTTAHAVMKLNSEDGGNRKFIMVQLPELTDESSDAYKAGYTNLCEIGKERIRRAGEQIKQELMDKKNKAGLLVDNIIDPDAFDNGFKVFKLDSTNINPWDGTIKLDETTIFTQSEVIKEDRSNLDVLYEIMLKYGVFDKPAKEIKVNTKTMYSVADGYLIVCLDNNITLEDVKEIGKLKPRNVIFKESGFANDNDKINATYTLEKLGVEEIKSI